MNVINNNSSTSSVCIEGGGATGDKGGGGVLIIMIGQYWFYWPERQKNITKKEKPQWKHQIEGNYESESRKGKEKNKVILIDIHKNPHTLYILYI